MTKTEELVEDSELTRAAIAERLGVSAGHLTRVLSGERPLTGALARDLAIVLGVKVRDLDGYEGGAAP